MLRTTMISLLRSNRRILAAHEIVYLANFTFKIKPMQLPLLRFKYTQHQGVKGIRSRKSNFDTNAAADEEADQEAFNENKERLNLDDRIYDEVVSGAMHVTRDFKTVHNVLIIQPFVKWGSKRNVQITPDDQLQEAEALIRSLPNWSVAAALKVPLESLDKKLLFGRGKLSELKSLVRKQQQQQQSRPLTCIFISKSSLTFPQKRFLEAEFQLPVMDRYSIVIQILRLHATSAEARLQVAMAEIPYIWAQARDANPSMSRKQGFSLTDTQREILKTRERKLKLELERIREQRKLLRQKRKQKNYPIVAVVGYTNAGKTSLIKALTDEQKMQPRDQLFATLDVTAHAGILPCNLEVIYMDTVGFMSDLPTGLIECFVATLEDAMLADVIIHVQDISHACSEAQRAHVETTLANLAENISLKDAQIAMPPIINVGNKVDLLVAANNLTNSSDYKNLHLVSSKTLQGLNTLLGEIEAKVLTTTGRRKLKMRVPSGGVEMAWLYKNAAVVDVQEDKANANQLLMDIVCTDLVLQQFKRQFC